MYKVIEIKFIDIITINKKMYLLCRYVNERQGEEVKLIITSKKRRSATGGLP